MTQSPLVSREQAHDKPTHHQFVPGIGYLAHSGPPDLPADARGTKNCLPPPGTKDGSEHVLNPPGGHPPMSMWWVAAESAWRARTPDKGNRLAWTTEHLSRAGWEYAGPAEPPAPAKKRR